MSLDIPRALCRRVKLPDFHISSIIAPGIAIIDVELTKLDIIPALFPIAACIAIVVVRFPYLGTLVGSQARGRPTTTYNPAATRKQPA